MRRLGIEAKGIRCNMAVRIPAVKSESSVLWFGASWWPQPRPAGGRFVSKYSVLSSHNYIKVYGFCVILQRKIVLFLSLR